MILPPQDEPPLTHQRARASGDRLYTRVLRWSLLASLALHLLLFFAGPRFDRSAGLRTLDRPDPEPVSRGMTVIDGDRLVVDAAAAPERLAEPVPSPRAVPEATLVPQPRAWQQPVPPVADAPAPGERGAEAAPRRDGNPFRVGEADPRLRVSERDVPQPSHHERYMAQLEERLRAYNDSIGAAADAARRATDWTVTDKDGRRWGISPGQIHLGGVTLPLPVGFQGSAEQRDRAEREAREREEIDRQGDAYDRDRLREESIKRTRERRDAERRGNDP